MEKLMMIDIETMGLEETDDIIQIGILECIKNSRGLYIPARSFVKVLHTDQEPQTDWIRNHHKDLLAISSKTEYELPAVVRAQILAFFKQCNVTTPTVIGLNVGSFDLPKLYKEGYLNKSDVHYRLYDITSIAKFIVDIKSIDSKELYKRADDYSSWYELPEGKAHDALYDCHKQLKNFNGMLSMMK